MLLSIYTVHTERELYIPGEICILIIYAFEFSSVTRIYILLALLIPHFDNSVADEILPHALSTLPLPNFYLCHSCSGFSYMISWS